MDLKATIAILLAATSINGRQQAQQQTPADEPAIRISTELVQLDVVVTDKKGRVVSGLGGNDFELSENGKKQQISFFEYVEAASGRRSASPFQQSGARPEPIQDSPQGLGAGDIRRIFAFVVDDLTVRFEDLGNLRDLLADFVENQMQPNDLVAIVRTMGGKGLLQQFTGDKALLRRAIDSLGPSTHPLGTANNPEANRDPLLEGGLEIGARDVTGNVIDPTNPLEATNRSVRAAMSLGTIALTIRDMKQLPGRKSLVLFSGGFPILAGEGAGGDPPTGPLNVEAGAIAHSLNMLADSATRAGVVIHTFDLRGMDAYRDVATFEEAPGKSMGQGRGGPFGRTTDENLLGRSVTDTHLGLRWLSSATGGVSVLKKNNLDEGLAQIVSASEGYYLLAYTPSDSNFDSRFRKVEVKVKGAGLKVYSRLGYYAREEKAARPATRRDELLAAVRSPLARRDIDLDAMLLYKALPTGEGKIDVHLVISPKKLRFEPANERQQMEIEVAGFIFDQLGRLRGGFSETLKASLTPEAFERVNKNGLSYSTDVRLPAGGYQIRVAVRDNATDNIGTLSRYVEIPNLSKPVLGASSLMLGSVPAGDTQAATPTPMTANRQIPGKRDLRYAVMIYNATLKDNRPQVLTQLTINQNGRVIFREAEEAVPAAALKDGQLLKWGQLGLSSVRPGRYTMTLTITDPLAEKRNQTVTRTMDFVVVN
ncbi:MAG TPA: VWA domain-containing protein [Blastocatellia bacterium]|nr:VWA domain-containing protein [Blastocatellia bacterium]